MPSGDRRSSLDLLRDHARAEVKKTSLRHVATHIGIEYSALNRFVKGSKPRALAMKRLEAWYEESADNVESLEQRVQELERMLAECKAKLGKR